MIASHRIRAACALAVLAAPAAAFGTTLNFAALSQPGSSYSGIGPTYAQDGFTFTSAALAVWQASSPNLPGLDPANTSLFEFYAGNTTTFNEGGSAFTLNSIDLAPFLAGGTGSFDVTFTGSFADGTSIQQTCAVNDGTTALLQTCSFTNFTDVVQVSFTQGTNIGYLTGQSTAYQFDNVVIDNSSTTGGTVPEPATLSLLGLGILGAGFARRRAVRSAG